MERSQLTPNIPISNANSSLLPRSNEVISATNSRYMALLKAKVESSSEEEEGLLMIHLESSVDMLKLALDRDIQHIYDGVCRDLGSGGGDAVSGAGGMTSGFDSSPIGHAKSTSNHGPSASPTRSNSPAPLLVNVKSASQVIQSLPPGSNLSNDRNLSDGGLLEHALKPNRYLLVELAKVYANHHGSVSNAHQGLGAAMTAGVDSPIVSPVTPVGGADERARGMFNATLMNADIGEESSITGGPNTNRPVFGTFWKTMAVRRYLETVLLPTFDLRCDDLLHSTALIWRKVAYQSKLKGIGSDSAGGPLGQPPKNVASRHHARTPPMSRSMSSPLDRETDYGEGEDEADQEEEINSAGGSSYYLEGGDSTLSHSPSGAYSADDRHHYHHSVKVRATIDPDEAEEEEEEYSVSVSPKSVSLSPSSHHLQTIATRNRRTNITQKSKAVVGGIASGSRISSLPRSASSTKGAPRSAAAHQELIPMRRSFGDTFGTEDYSTNDNTKLHDIQIRASISTKLQIAKKRLQALRGGNDDLGKRLEQQRAQRQREAQQFSVRVSRWTRTLDTLLTRNKKLEEQIATEVEQSVAFGTFFVNELKPLRRFFLIADRTRKDIEDGEQEEDQQHKQHFVPGLQQPKTPSSILEHAKSTPSSRPSDPKAMGVDNSSIALALPIPLTATTQLGPTEQQTPVSQLAAELFQQHHQQPHTGQTSRNRVTGVLDVLDDLLYKTECAKLDLKEAEKVFLELAAKLEAAAVPTQRVRSDTKISSQGFVQTYAKNTVDLFAPKPKHQIAAADSASLGTFANEYVQASKMELLNVDGKKRSGSDESARQHKYILKVSPKKSNFEDGFHSWDRLPSKKRVFPSESILQNQRSFSDSANPAQTELHEDPVIAKALKADYFRLTLDDLVDEDTTVSIMPNPSITTRHEVISLHSDTSGPSEVAEKLRRLREKRAALGPRTNAAVAETPKLQAQTERSLSQQVGHRPATSNHSPQRRQAIKSFVAKSKQVAVNGGVATTSPKEREPASSRSSSFSNEVKMRMLELRKQAAATVAELRRPM